MVILVIACLALIFVTLQGGGVGNGTTGGLSPKKAVAKVGGEEITTGELINAYQRQMDSVQQYAQSNPQMLKYFRETFKPENILESLIGEKSQIAFAKNLGLSASPDEISYFIKNNQQFYNKGTFDRIRYQNIVRDKVAYENQIANFITSTKARKLLSTGLLSQSNLQSKIDQALNKEYIFDFVKIDPKTIKVNKPSKEQINEFVASPESAILLKNYYNNNISKFKTSETVKAQHILVKTIEEANKVREEIKSKKITFADAAKNHSTDKSNSSKGGDLGYFPRNQMVKEFDQAVFEKLKVNELSEPIKTQFGYHLIIVNDKKAATEKKLEEVKSQIAGDVLMEKNQKQQASRLVAKWSNSGSRPTNKELSKNGLKWEKAAAWKPGASQLPSVGVLQKSDIEGLLKISKNGEYYPKTINQGNNIFLLKLNSINSEKVESSGEQRTANISSDFWQNVKKQFEDNKKIHKSKKILAKMNEIIDAQNKQQGNVN